MKFTGSAKQLCTVLIKCSTIQAGGGYWIKYRNVDYTVAKLERLKQYLEKKLISWEHINVYAKDSRKFLEQIKK